MKNKIILAGGSGFLGRMLRRYFTGKGWEVVVLSRSVGAVRWNGDTIGEWGGGTRGGSGRGESRWPFGRLPLPCPQPAIDYGFAGEIDPSTRAGHRAMPAAAKGLA